MVDKYVFSDDFEEVVLAGTLLSYLTPHITEQRFNDLRTGRVSWEAKLDLTGFSADRARQALSEFIHTQVINKKNCVLIVHGIESTVNTPPLLKNLINHWLPQSKDVLAFHSAAIKDGGAGAVYVLLREAKNLEALILPVKEDTSFLVSETKSMERRRRLAEQQGERQWGSVKAREHSEEEQSPSPEGELQNTILQHPELNSQRFDGIDPNLNPEPPLNTDARREFDNERREQEMEKQLRLGNMPKFSSAPTPKGP